MSTPGKSSAIEPTGAEGKVDTGVTRRAALGHGLVGGGLVAGGLAVASGLARAADAAADQPLQDPSWSKSLGPGVADVPYGQPSPFEKDVIRRTVPWLTATQQSSISFSPIQHQAGIITPNGLFFERYHAGRPDVDPAEHRLLIHGMVDKPLLLTMKDIGRFPSTSRIHFIECPANGGMEWRAAQLNSVQFNHGMVSCAEWTGVKLSTLLGEVGLKPKTSWVLAEGADGAHMDRSLPLEKCLDDCLVVYAQNGEMLRPEQGYPLRLIVPGWQGNVNIKWLRRLEVGDQPWFTREETAQYTELMPDGKARAFTWTIYAKSVVTFPCPENPMKGPGLYEIRGLAWSGNGKIAKVDVSMDGGINWVPTTLQEPVLSKALTKFTAEWRWDGSPALVQSRAVDETGFVQPTLAALRQVRGTNGIYNNNSIQDLAGEGGWDGQRCPAGLDASPPWRRCSSPARGLPPRPHPPPPPQSPSAVGHFGYGTIPSAKQISGWDIAVLPNGQGLPPGSGNVEHGADVFSEQCAACHGTFGEGVDRYPKLASDSALTGSQPSKAVGNYWPYATTLWDYINRAMPFPAPNSLPPDDVYAITAYVLNLNNIVGNDFVADKDTLPKVVMPNRNGFILKDPRPDTAATECMKDCRDPASAKIVSSAASGDLTPKTTGPLDLAMPQ